MEFTITHSEHRLCTCCMEEHDVKTIRMKEHTIFKNTPVDYVATYYYCDTADEFYADETQMQENDLAMKDSYRKSQGLLTTGEIMSMRAMYGISQSDLCTLLGWGGKTITRYESHQVQDKAHDTILKKLGNDPEWFLTLLEESRSHLSVSLYKKYRDNVTALYEKKQDLYLRKSIEAKYARFDGSKLYQGNTRLSLDKTVDAIRYFASSDKITNLYKVKLMKLLWYSDALSYKQRGNAITGLVYQALPMGAVPIGHDSIIDLKGVPCEEIDMGETYAYHFTLTEHKECPSLSSEDKGILDTVINRLGSMSKNEIINFMHKEKAYTETAPRGIISFQYAENLQI